MNEHNIEINGVPEGFEVVSVDIENDGLYLDKDHIRRSAIVKLKKSNPARVDVDK